MMLLTKAIAKKLPALYEGGKVDPIIYLKLFNPCGRWTLYVSEYDPVDRIMYGFCVSAQDSSYSEWGYTSLTEVERVKVPPFGIGIERDMYFNPAPLTAALAGDRWSDELVQVKGAVV